MHSKNIIDKRSIDTFIFFLSQSINVDDITYSSNIEHDLTLKKRPYPKFNNHLSPKYTIDISLAKDILVFQIFKKSNFSNFDCITFYAHPSIKRARYILNTSKNIYKHSVEFYKPYKFILKLKKTFLKVMIYFGYKRNNIKVFFDKNDKVIRKTLSSNFYTGVYDGKQTFVSMLISNDIVSGYMKLRPNESKLINSQNEYLFAKKFANMVDNKKIIVPNIKRIKNKFKPLIISSSYYQRSFNIKKDIKLVYDFLKSIQKEGSRKNVFEIFDDFKSLGKEFQPIFNILKDYYFDVSYCHGDLSPWNFYISDDKLFIYDFETSENNVPISYDFVTLSNSYYRMSNKLYLPFLKKLISNYFKFLNKKISKLEIQKYMLVSLMYYLLK